jgi:hypothetical protein
MYLYTMHLHILTQSLMAMASPVEMPTASAHTPFPRSLAPESIDDSSNLSYCRVYFKTRPFHCLWKLITGQGNI